MRDDIAKKLCERPRFGGGGKYQLRSDRRKAKNERHWDSLPKKESMKRPNIKGWNGKYLSEYFPPLLGFLRKNVGRPWDKVFSEICEHLSPSSTVQKHVFDHLLGDFVVTNPHFVGKIPYHPEYRTSEVHWFYVDHAGLLKNNNSDKAKARRNRDRKRTRNQDKRKRINDHEEYRKINGAWFHVWYDHLRVGERGYDVIQKKEFQVSRWGCWELQRKNGKATKGGKDLMDTYRLCVDKKQISKREIRVEGLNKL